MSQLQRSQFNAIVVYKQTKQGQIKSGKDVISYFVKQFSET